MLGGIFGAVVFSSGGIASSALGQRQLTLFFDRMLLRMSIRLSRRAVGFQLSLCALKASKYTLTRINTSFGWSDRRVHAVFWRGRNCRMIEWLLLFPAADELLREIEPIRSHFFVESLLDKMPFACRSI